MITLTKLNDTPFIINDDLIESIEETPDTVITFDNGRTVVVKENGETIIRLVKEFRRDILDIEHRVK